MKATLVIERLDKDSRVLERRELPSHSFVKGFIGLLYLMHGKVLAASPYAMPDINNASKNLDTDPSGWSKRPKGTLMTGAPGGGGVLTVPLTISAEISYDVVESEKIGIVVGTGVNAVAPTDYALQTRVVHGRAGGQLEYSGCGLLNFLIAGAVVSFDLVRYFANNSGGPITINECGIYSVGTGTTVQGSQYAWSFCSARDLVAPGVAVAHTELLRVTYTISTTV